MTTYHVFKLEITCANAAFDGDRGGSKPELARMLRSLAEDFEHGGLPYEHRFDSNGNACGSWKFIYRKE